MQDVLAKFRAEYHISTDTPIGRVDWAVNDYIEGSDTLTDEQKEFLVFATHAELVGD